jgi:hypothetical protein
MIWIVLFAIRANHRQTDLRTHPQTHTYIIITILMRTHAPETLGADSGRFIHANTWHCCSFHENCQNRANTRHQSTYIILIYIYYTKNVRLFQNHFRRL